MRTSLLPGLLRAAAHARRHGERHARLFTVGPVFLGPSEEILPDERLVFAALLVGDRAGWLSPPEGVDVWDAKGLAEGLVQRMLHRPTTLLPIAETDRPRSLHPRGAAWIEVAGKRVGSLGPLHPDVAEAWEVGDRAVLVEVDLEALQAVGVKQARFASLPRFPSSTRDLAVVVRDDVPAGDVEHAARDAAGDLAEEVTLFDRFVGGSVPSGHASLALHVVYRAPDRTLTDGDVDVRHAQVLAAVQKRFGASLRGSS
jgi:phenylalanyl-tRNA synthetase beta chain